MNELETLRLENETLRARVLELEGRLGFLATHKTVAAGISGERIISDIVGGRLTAYAASFDVMTPSGVKIEVKKATPSKSEAGGSSTRWQWGKVLGESGSKTYDFLLLIGESDARFAHLYRDTESPFVMFCVPFASVLEVSTAGQQRTRIARVTTNPAGVRSISGTKLYDDFQVTMSELAERFGLSG